MKAATLISAFALLAWKPAQAQTPQYGLEPYTCDGPRISTTIDGARIVATYGDVTGSVSGTYVSDRNSIGEWVTTAVLPPLAGVPSSMLSSSRNHLSGRWLATGISTYGPAGSSLNARPGVVVVRELDTNGAVLSTQWIHRPEDSILRFGTPLQILDDRLVVGSIHRTGSAENSGAVYVYERDVDIWHLTHALYPEDFGFNVERGYAFGRQVAIEGDDVYVCSIGPDSVGGVSTSNAGVMDVFRESDGKFTHLQRIFGPTGPQESHRFAQSVAVEDNILALGRTFRGQAPGEILVYARANSSEPWMFQSILEGSYPATSNTAPRDGLGEQISISDGAILGSAYRADYGQINSPGVIYHFKQNAGGFYGPLETSSTHNESFHNVNSFGGSDSGFGLWTHPNPLTDCITVFPVGPEVSVCQPGNSTGAPLSLTTYRGNPSDVNSLAFDSFALHGAQGGESYIVFGSMTLNPGGSASASRGGCLEPPYFIAGRGFVQSSSGMQFVQGNNLSARWAQISALSGVTLYLQAVLLKPGAGPRWGDAVRLTL